MAWASRNKTFNPFSWWGMLTLSIVAGLLAGALVALFWPSTYKASSSFFVSDPAELLATVSKTEGAAGAADGGKVQPSHERLAAILSSRLLRAQVAKKHGLAQRLAIDPVEAEEELAKMAKVNPIGTEGFSIQVTCKGYTPLRVAISHDLRREDARTLCADLANDYLAQLQRYVVGTSVSEARKKREFIQNAQRDVLRQLDKTQAGIERLQRAHALLDPQSQAALIGDRLRALQQSDAEARAKVDETQSSLKKAQGQLGRVAAMRIASVVEMRNPIIGQLEQKISDLRLQIATEQAQGKTAQHRDVVQLTTALQAAECQLVQVREDVHKEIARSANPTHEKIVGQVVDLQVAAAGARARSARTASLLAAAKSEMAELPPVERQYALLKQDQEIQLQSLSSLKQSLAVALLQEQQSKRVGEFLVLDQAVAPPDLHRPPVLWSMIIVAGSLLAVMGLMGLNRMIFGA